MNARAAAGRGAIAALVALPICGASAGPQEAASDAEAWVRETLASLSLREKVGQMLMTFHYSRFSGAEDPAFAKMKGEIEGLGVGGFVFSLGTVAECAALANEVQRASKLPLLLAADFEAGAGFRIDGATAFPWNMAVGAAGSERLAREEGSIAAAEARAMGIHWLFAPVLDVQRNPDNPIINTRAYGEDPGEVGRLGAAFVRGAREGGVLCTAKHFPGHGATDTDSHLALPTVSASAEEIRRVDVAPFAEAIAAGVDAIMTAHLALPALTGERDLPATLSPRVMGRLLREELRFEGLLVTDALGMSGVSARYGPGEAAVEAVRAGADVLLMPADPEAALEAVIREVERGRIRRSRIDASVERLLRAKARLGLHRERGVDLERAAASVGSAEHLARAAEVAEASITLVANGKHLVPIGPTSAASLLVVTVVDREEGGGETPPVFEQEVAARAPGCAFARVGPSTERGELEEAGRRAGAADAVLIALHVRPRAWGGSVEVPEPVAGFLERIAPRAAVVSFGNPYLFRRLPEAGAAICAYSSVEVSQRAAARAVFGEIPFHGRLPVSIPGVAPRGAGIRTWVRPAQERIDALFAAVAAGVEEGAFPGAVAVLGVGDEVFGPRAFGRLSSEPDSPPATEETVYDLASLTKVVATTTAAMILVGEGRLRLEDPVRRFVPGFTRGGREAVTVRHLLTHASGLPAFGPLYERLEGKRAYVEEICTIDLLAPPGTKTVYSDFGAILLGAVVERAAGKPLDEYCEERIFAPLGMRSTRFRPPESWLPRIAPTEEDPRRGGVVRGRVHDENADAMGGVSGHAGLFSTAGDLARFCRMMLRGGELDGVRVVEEEVVRRFTRRADGVPGSTRALGWDTPGAEHFAAPLGPDSYGHTGFTGTSIWIAPDRDVFVVLLSNRVHPTRANRGIDTVRRAVHAY